MSIWLYEIRKVGIPPGVDLDDRIEKVLREYGEHGWELVQVLGGTGTEEEHTFRLIFKTEKPLVGQGDMGTSAA